MRSFLKNKLFKNIYNHLISNNLLTKNQYGFRPDDSTTNQLLFLVYSIHNSFDHKDSREVRSVFLDMSKAFDKVWHTGLIFKLKQNGMDGKLLSLIGIYLSDGKQRVVINGSVSSWGAIQAGVPQGSVTLLFLIYIIHLEEGINSFTAASRYKRHKHKILPHIDRRSYSHFLKSYRGLTVYIYIYIYTEPTLFC